MFLLLPFAPRSLTAHTEIAGRLIFENFENELYVRAELDKRLLTVALMYEGDCPPREMLAVCGDQYLREHLKITVNCTETDLEKLSMEIQHRHVIFSYKVLHPNEQLRSIGVSSSYLLKYNDHAIVRTHFDIDLHTKSYDLNASRQSIEATFNSTSL